MQDFLLDGNHVTALFREKPNVVAKARTYNAERKWFVSWTVISEIKTGHGLADSADPAECQRLLDFIKTWCVEIDPKDDISTKFAEILKRLNAVNPKIESDKNVQAWLQRIGVQMNDVWLVAQAWAHNLICVTTDKMKQIKGVLQQEITDRTIRFDDWDV